jgi:hypothetical protein
VNVGRWWASLDHETPAHRDPDPLRTLGLVAAGLLLLVIAAVVLIALDTNPAR